VARLLWVGLASAILPVSLYQMAARLPALTNRLQRLDDAGLVRQVEVFAAPSRRQRRQTC
jgi:hypothetical protein